MISADILPSITRLQIPARYQIKNEENGLSVNRLLTTEREVEVQLEPFRSRGVTCRRVLARTSGEEQFVLEFANFNDNYGTEIAGIIRARRPVIDGDMLVLEAPRFRESTLLPDNTGEIYRGIHSSWKAGIRYNSELTDDEGQILRPGFRQPQVGALHAIASHWTLSGEPAIVVMPTGTGKTEVMIATSIGAFCCRLLVVVPTDALRRQTADKFETYGILREIGIIGDLPFPIVGLLSSRLTRSHLDKLSVCNVVVSTMRSIGLAEEGVQQEFTGLFSHIFFDEAHHIEAATWKRFQKYCGNSKTLLLTATPFREDGKPLEGKIIYNFPLSMAQDLGYFKPIHFAEVFEPDERHADRRIADEAVSQLREDLEVGYDHILMARTQTIDAAKRLYESIYEPSFGDLNPVLIHSRTPRKQAVLDAIKNGQHKIIVCVDMFGEGFDLPNLKVAALHTVHKSLGITLQFIGRFTRATSGVGAATFVANTAEDGVPEALESLYWEDADWNLLLADLSYDAIDPQARLSELVDNLEAVRAGEEEIEISTLALRPKISAKVYRTSAFFPERFSEAFRPSQRIFQPQISRRDNFLVLVVNQQENIDWTDSRDIAVDSWDLYIAYFDPNQELLYVHSSRKGDSTSRLAKSISHNPVLIHHEETFKVFSGLRRLTLHSVGLTSRSRNVRYQMFAGLDVRNAIDPVQQQTKLKSNITGVGYEEGERLSVGCSRKGKIWSMRSGSLAQWKAWCDQIGAKLSNPDSGPDDFLKYTLIPMSINTFPQTRALMADWPDQLFESSNFRFEVIAGENSYGFDDCQIDLVEWNGGGDSFQFRLQVGNDIDSILRLQLESIAEGEDGYKVARVSGPDLEIDAVRRRWSIVEFFDENPPLVRLEDGSQLAGNILLQPQDAMGDTYDAELIRTLDWTGVDITKESRWRDGAVRQNSVQQHFIEHLEAGPATFIIDDDDTGECADIVAIEETDNTITVYLWHCKYSSGDEPGHRIADLYEVCGQAQKCVKWTWNLRTLIRHLINRETKYKHGRDTRFIRGSLADLATLRKSARRKFVEYKVGVVQPGLLKANIPPEHLAILGSTNSFVQCITDSPLSVVASE
jgi:superfamily II DNA or RNA helicase